MALPKKVGIEWVNNYGSRFPPLTNSGLNAQGFRNRMIPAGGGTGNAVFERGDGVSGGQALATDVEQDLTDTTASRDATVPQDSVVAPPGSDAGMAEMVDILYFSGHGTFERLFFNGANLDEQEAWNTEMRLGENGLKWFVADACDVLTTTYGVFDVDENFISTLGNDVRIRWRRIFRGLRYLLGFHGSCSDVHNRGEFFANQLNLGDTISHAWEIACEESERDEFNNPKRYMPWAYLRAGDALSAVKDDKWATTFFNPLPDSAPPAYTYVRNIPPPAPTTTTTGT